MTGMLRPDSGQIFLGERGDHRAASRDARVQARPRAHVPDQHPVPAAERARVGDARGARARRAPATGGAGCRAIARAIDEAQAILAFAAAGVTSLRDRRASWLTASSACWRSRSRSPPGRRCCCSTSRRPACRRTRARELFEAIASLSREPHHPVHRARHGRGVPLRQPHHRDGRRPHPGRGHAATRSPRDERVREVYLGKRDMAEPLLELTRRARRLRRRRGARRRLARGAAQRQPGRARPQRRRQVARCC